MMTMGPQGVDRGRERSTEGRQNINGEGTSSLPSGLIRAELAIKSFFHPGVSVRSDRRSVRTDG